MRYDNPSLSLRLPKGRAGGVFLPMWHQPMNLFAYGSLMIPSVMHAVTGRHFVAKRAYLNDYARFKVKGETYPGIIYQRKAVTEGIVHLDIDVAYVRRLDEFEGEMYSRVSVAVETEEPELLRAETYVIKPEYRHRLSSESWDLEEFERNHLRDFMDNYNGFSMLKKEKEPISRP